MCGIAGIVRVWDSGDVPRPMDAIPEAWLDILDDSIKHRGPDGHGRFRHRVARPDGAIVDVALVHRRLSIIDLAGGAQPMVIGLPQSHDAHRAPRASVGSDQPSTTASQGTSPNSDTRHPTPPLLSTEGGPYQPLPHPHACPACDASGGGVTAVVFNGCIYNHRDLRRELEAAGHAFHTDHSDTEVLLHGWRAWGAGLIDRLDGMYAFGLWEERGATLVYARDFAGEKPLYAGHRADLGTRYFSSAPPGLVRLNTQWGPPPLHDEDGEPALWHSHARHHVPLWFGGADWEMPYPDTEEVPPKFIRVVGTVVSDSRRTWSYVRPQAVLPRLDAESLDAMLRGAVESRLEADVPLGCFLSGGVDSSLIAHYAKSATGSLRTFTVRMPDPKYDESPHAERVASLLETDHATLECEASPAEDLPRLIHQIGLPFGDSSLLPAYWLSKAAARHVRVALSGDGGDELFGGYERYIAKQRAAPLQHLLAVVPIFLLPDRDPKSIWSKLRRLVRACRTGDLQRVGLGAMWDDTDAARLRGDPVSWPQHVPLLGAIRRLPRWWERVGSGRKRWPEDDDMIADFLHYLPEDLLRKADTASMAVALEVRAPFLQRDLAIAALAEPLSSLMPRGQRKGLLKAVARKYLPDEIVDRPKQGFAIPISDWFRTDYGGMRGLLLDHLTAPDPFPGLADAGVHLNMAFVRRMLKEHDDAGKESLWPWKGRDHGQRLYMLLVLSIWCRWLERVRRGG